MHEVMFIYKTRNFALITGCSRSPAMLVINPVLSILTMQLRRKQTVGGVFRVHIKSANTKISVFGPCILFVRLLAFSEQTAIILVCNI
jgi:hypothetical protein